MKCTSVVYGNSIPQTNEVDAQLLKESAIVKFNHHWLLTNDCTHSYTVVVHDSSIHRTLSELATRNVFDRVNEMVICCSVHENRERNRHVLRHMQQYKKQLGATRIRILTLNDMYPVLCALRKRGFPTRWKPRTGLVYILWLVSQNHRVFITGFDIENTDENTHALEPTVPVSRQHNPEAESLILRQLIAEKLVVVL